MRETGIAKLFKSRRSQAVRLPLESLIADPAEWFAELDRVRERRFLGKGRNQPVTPRRKIFK